MATDLFERLSETDVPPPPVELDRAVHERVNRALVVGQLLDFAMRAMPFAAWHLARAVGGWISLTITGRFPAGPGDDR